MRAATAVFMALSVLWSGLTLAESREEVAWKMIDQGALVVDVRTEAEFAGGHLEDAILIPHPVVVDRFALLEVPKDREVVLYCRSGNRAGIAEAALRRAGYTHVYNGGGYRMLKNHPR